MTSSFERFERAPDDKWGHKKRLSNRKDIESGKNIAANHKSWINLYLQIWRLMVLTQYLCYRYWASTIIHFLYFCLHFLYFLHLHCYFCVVCHHHLHLPPCGRDKIVFVIASVADGHLTKCLDTSPLSQRLSSSCT